MFISNYKNCFDDLLGKLAGTEPVFISRMRKRHRRRRRLPAREEQEPGGRCGSRRQVHAIGVEIQRLLCPQRLGADLSELLRRTHPDLRELGDTTRLQLPTVVLVLQRHFEPGILQRGL